MSRSSVDFRMTFFARLGAAAVHRCLSVMYALKQGFFSIKIRGFSLLRAEGIS